MITITYEFTISPINITSHLRLATNTPLLASEQKRITQHTRNCLTTLTPSLDSHAYNIKSNPHVQIRISLCN